MYFIFLVCFVFFHALSRCIKFLKAPTLVLGFMNVIKLLCNKVTFIKSNAFVVSFKNFIHVCYLVHCFFFFFFNPMLCKTVLWLTGTVYRIYALHFDVC